MKKKQMKHRHFCLLTLAALMAAACTGQRSHGEKPVITVTIEPQRYFTEAIAGNKFDVVSLVPKGASPETYDPIPQQLVSLGESKAYFRIGYIGFEQTWLERLTSNAPHLQVFDTSKGIDFILTDDGHCHEPDGHLHGVDPHVWSSATNALRLAENTYKALCLLDKGGEPYYRPRYDSLCREIRHTDSLIRRQLSTPGAARSFMIYHPTLSYFARDYGLRQLCIEEGGKEPSPAQLKRLIDTGRAEGVRIIFVQPEFDRRNAETIARQTGAKVAAINPLSYEWQKEMLRVAEALASAERSEP